MPRLIVHGFTISFTVALLLASCKGDADDSVAIWNERIAEQERISDAAKGDSVVSKGTEEHGRTVAYYIAGEKVKEEYHYHGRLVSCYNFSGGQLNGYGIEWNRDGTLFFVAHYVDGKLDGTTETQWRGHGQKTVTTYRMGEQIHSDTVPLTDRDSPHFERDAPKH